MRTRYGLDRVPEPLWVEPGTAMYWQLLEVGKGRRGTRRDGVTPVARMQFQEKSWVRVGPLPANEASQIAHYLKDRGFQLREPGTLVVVPVPAAEAGEPGPAERPWRCVRHGRPLGFMTWRAYVEHCDAYDEVPEGAPPEAKERAGEYPYYCPLHDVGFESDRMARRHVSQYRYAKGRRHPTVQEMAQGAAAA